MINVLFQTVSLRKKLIMLTPNRLHYMFGKRGLGGLWEGVMKMINVLFQTVSLRKKLMLTFRPDGLVLHRGEGSILLH